MIVLFEGARCTGKTTLSTVLLTRLNSDGFPVERWKAERGEFPYQDMLATLSSDFDDRSMLWLVDRFHLTEYVNSVALGRVKGADKKEELWLKTMNIDRLLRLKDTILVCMMSSTYTRERRLIAEERKDEAETSLMNALWIDTFRRSELPKIGIFNNTERDLEQGCDILAQYIEAYWDKTHVVI